MRLFVLLLILSLFSCSSEEEILNSGIPEVPEPIVCCTQNLIHREDSVLVSDSLTNHLTSRASVPFDKITLFSFDDGSTDDDIGEECASLDFPVMKSGELNYADICFNVDLDREKFVVIEALNENGEVIPVSYPLIDWVHHGFRGRPCYFSSQSKSKISLEKSTVLTPGRQSTYKPLSSPVYVSPRYKFGCEIFSKSIYYKASTDLIRTYLSPEHHMKLNLYDISSLLKVRILVTDLDGYNELFDQPSYSLERDRFTQKLGYVKDWSIAVFLDNVPNEYPIVSPKEEGDAIIALSDKVPMTSGIVHSEKRLNKTIHYMGLGMRSYAEGYVLPFDTNDAYLKFSFYYRGNKNFKYKKVTLRLNVDDDLGLETALCSEIVLTAIIDWYDLENAMKGNYINNLSSISRYNIIEEDGDRIELEMPYKKDVQYVKHYRQLTVR